jgi:hypothetical protein
MILKDTKQVLAVGLSIVLITTSSYGFETPTQFRKPRVAPQIAHP